MNKRLFLFHTEHQLWLKPMGLITLLVHGMW